MLRKVLGKLRTEVKSKDISARSSDKLIKDITNIFQSNLMGA